MGRTFQGHDNVKMSVRINDPRAQKTKKKKKFSNLGTFPCETDDDADVDVESI